MAAPKIVLLARRDIRDNLDAVQAFFQTCPLQMAVASSNEDAEEAQKLTNAVAKFQHFTAIVADYPASLVIDENGEIVPLVLSPASEISETPLIEVVSG